MEINRVLFTLLSIILLTSTLCMADTSFLRQLIKPGDLVFDVGAHKGNKTAAYLSLGAKVICVEPQQDCCDFITRRFRGNSNVQLEPVGLAEIPGTLKFFICTSSNTISTFSQEWKEKSRHSQRGYVWDSFKMVPVTTLDLLIKKHGVPQFCKIDVENFEHKILRGLSKPIPGLSIEFHSEVFHNAVKCLDYLEKLGYSKFNFVAGEQVKFVLKKWTTKEYLIKEIMNFSLTYYLQTKDFLWGDIYAVYP